MVIFHLPIKNGDLPRKNGDFLLTYMVYHIKNAW